jgi:acyl carrier protein
LLENTPLRYLYAIRLDGNRRLIREQPAGAHRVAIPSFDDGIPAPADLQLHLRQRLPEYMVPAQFMLMDTWPLTPNGKIDRRALPAIDRPGRGLSETYVAPRTRVEEQIAQTWSEVLGLPRVGIHDNFFELGGHSLLAVRIASRLREVLKVEFSLRSLFDSPTVAGLAVEIEALRWARQVQLNPIEDLRTSAPTGEL